MAEFRLLQSLRPGSLWARLLLPLALAIVLAGTLRTWLLIQEERTDAQAAQIHLTETLGTTLALALGEQASDRHRSHIQTMLAQTAANQGVLAVEWQLLGRVELRADRLLRQPQGVPDWFITVFDLQPLTRSWPLTWRGISHGDLVLTADPTPLIEKSWQRVLNQARMVAVVVVLLVVVLSLVLRTSLKGLSDLVNASRALQQGQISTRLRPVGAREVRSVATAFNTMAEQIGELLNRLRLARTALFQEKERLEITLASIAEAVIATDAEGRIRFMNPMAERLIGCERESVYGQTFESVVQIIQDSNRMPIEPPVRQSLGDARTVTWSDHTLLRRNGGPELMIEGSAAPIHDGVLHVVGAVMVFRDVTDRIALQRRIAWQAGHDALTGLPNRMLIRDRLEQAMAQARRDGSMLAVCFIDLDGFKAINDRYGHAVGDRMLVTAAQRLRSTLRSIDSVARLGGDEFIVLLSSIVSFQELDQVLTRLIDSISQPVVLESAELRLRASIGVSVFPQDDSEADVLLRHADLAMYQSKQDGGHQYRLFNPHDDQGLQLRQKRIDRIARAIADGEMRLLYRPRVELGTGRLIGLEAAVHWNHPDEGELMPTSFMPLIQDAALIAATNDWMIGTALSQLQIWVQQGHTNWPVSVPLLCRDLQDATFVERLKAALSRQNGVAAPLLELEIHESGSLEDLQQIDQTLEACRQLGVRVVLDQFGQGYASLLHLKRLPADRLKIDPGFVRGMIEERSDLATVEAIVTMARLFGREVSAEGIDTAEQGTLLMRLGCPAGQGNRIAAPMKGDEVAEWAGLYAGESSWSIWAGTDWRLEDFPLLMAEHDHHRWVRQIIASTQGNSPRLGAEEICDHHRCRFGRWFDGEGQHRYGHLEAFKAIEPVHVEVHQLGMSILQLGASGHVEEAQAQVERLSQCRDDIVVRLMDLQRAVASPAPPPGAGYGTLSGQLHDLGRASCA
jgi:diguanylate cyclase (GGDEF)-like protein/PAS domain S-box-containing protein